MDDILAQIKGDIGEALTASELRNKLSILVLRNVYLQYGQRLVEIDMIGFSTRGIFVIENKNYSGVVRGSEDKVTWTVSGHRFYSPVEQNKTHLEAVQRVLDQNGIGYKPIGVVLFNNTEVHYRGSSNVYTLVDFISSFNRDFPANVMYAMEAIEYYNIFRQYSNSSPYVRKLHKLLLNKEITFEDIVFAYADLLHKE